MSYAWCSMFCESPSAAFLQRGFAINLHERLLKPILHEEPSVRPVVASDPTCRRTVTITVVSVLPILPKLTARL